MSESILKRIEGFSDGNRWAFYLGWKSTNRVCMDVGINFETY